MKRIFVILLSVSILLVACNKEDDSKVADSSINGLLVAENDSVVRNAMVTLYQNEVAMSQSVSDSLGKFNFENVVSGTYKIGAYNEKLKNSPLLEYEVKANTVHELTFVFHATISVTGVLLDKNKNPYSKKEVYLIPQSEHLKEQKSASIIEESMTDDLGNFNFYSVEPGLYMLYYYSLPSVREYKLIRVEETLGTTILLTSSEPAYWTFTDARDGKTYKYVKIGSQYWMAENLAYLPQVDIVTLTSTTTPYYYVYGYTPTGADENTQIKNAKLTANFLLYGVLYNGMAVLNGQTASTSNPSGIRGIAPKGWHIPSNAEWTQLKDYATANSGIAGPGMALKANSTLWNTNTGVDTYGFGAVPDGYCQNAFYQIGQYGYYYTATSFYMQIYYNNNTVDGPYGGTVYGMSVRCVKD